MERRRERLELMRSSVAVNAACSVLYMRASPLAPEAAKTRSVRHSLRTALLVLVWRSLGLAAVCGPRPTTSPAPVGDDRRTQRDGARARFGVHGRRFGT